MAKRKLTRQQKWRIEKIRQERLQRAQRKQHAHEDDVADQLGELRTGLITAHYGQQVEVESADNLRQRCHFRATLEQLVTGDHVLWQPAESEGLGVVTAIEPRRNVLCRPDPYGKLKPVAANVDHLIIVFAPEPTPSSLLLDRYLVAAELSQITPVLLLNKTDLLNDTTRPDCEALIALYQQVGYPVYQASATEQLGLAPLSTLLRNSTNVFVGQSGVGKSSLVNALLPDAEAHTAALSDTSGLGQHTTVTAQLFHLPEGGMLIDSPGIREFGLWHISEDALLHGYIDLAPLAGRCRFRNCSHRHEPGCALIEASQTGQIHPQRLENFFAIADSLDDVDRGKYRN